jgi:hypothetical protein
MTNWASPFPVQYSNENGNSTDDPNQYLLWTEDLFWVFGSLGCGLRGRRRPNKKANRLLLYVLGVIIVNEREQVTSMFLGSPLSQKLVLLAG